MTASQGASLVGRDRELAQLREHLDHALAGRGGLVLIGGEAGIGKTALAEALCLEAEAQGALVLVGRCFDLSETPPYGPWIDLFTRYRRDADMPDLPPAFAQRGIFGEAANQAVLFQQVITFFTTLSARQPTVLLLDDLHWADLVSLDLLRALARSLAGQAILLVGTYRADALTRRHPLFSLLALLEREAHAARLDLRPFTADTIRQFIALRYHLRSSDATQFVAYLYARTDGNALFLLQLLRALEEDGVVRHEDGQWVIGDLVNVGVPMPLQQLIHTRVIHLGAEGQRLLGIAAVIGHEVVVRLWAAVATIDDETIFDLIERACAMHILEELADGGRVRFAHALVRDAMYAAIPAVRRRRLHVQIGEAMAGLPHLDPDAVAYHFRRAGDPRAIEWLVRAGERAQEAWAWLIAATRYEAALACMNDGEANPNLRGWLCYRVAVLRRFSHSPVDQRYLNEAARLAADTSDEVLTAHVRYYQGLLRPDNADSDRMLDDLAAGVAALSALAPVKARTNALFARVDPHSARGTLILRLARVGRFGEALTEAERWTAEIPAHASRDGDLGSSPDALYGISIAHAHLGHVQEAERSFAHARVLCEEAHHYPVLGGVLMDVLQLMVIPYHADNRAERRRLAEAIADALVKADEMGAYYPTEFAHAPLLLIEGKWDEAQILATSVFGSTDSTAAPRVHASVILAPIALAQGNGQLLASLIANRLPDGAETVPGTIYYNLALQQTAAAWAIETRDLVIARGWLEAHDHWLDWSGAVLGRSEGHVLWAQYYRATGDAVAAYATATRALQSATNPRQPLALLAAHRLLGELHTEAHRLTDAQTHLDAALALADACAAPYERALTLLAIAALHLGQGQADAAHTVIESARSICDSLGAKPARARADALAERVAAGRTTPAFPASLSAREVEVLRLLAAGRTNREIAEMLFLSERTVDTHVRHIFTKTRTDNRAAATAFAYQHNLM